MSDTKDMAAKAAALIKGPLPRTREGLRREHRRLLNFIERNEIAPVKRNGDHRKPDELTLREAEKRELGVRCMVFRDVIKRHLRESEERVLARAA